MGVVAGEGSRAHIVKGSNNMDKVFGLIFQGDGEHW